MSSAVLQPEGITALYDFNGFESLLKILIFVKWIRDKSSSSTSRAWNILRTNYLRVSLFHTQTSELDGIV